MQKKCKEKPESIYFRCRKEAAVYNDELNSRVGAAEKLGVSESSLRDYETGLTSVPVDIVVRMSDLYRAPELQTAYCRNDCPIGKYTCGTLSDELKNIDAVACSLVYHISNARISNAVDTLLRIASDGAISPEEVAELKKVVGELEEICHDVSDLWLVSEKTTALGKRPK